MVMKKFRLVVVLLVSAVCVSGCMPILGGIIGYQSNHAVAGVVIGAALEYGDDIIVALFPKPPIQKARPPITIYSDLGYIRVDCGLAHGNTLVQKLKKKFIDHSWRISETAAKKRRNITENFYRSRTADGIEFDLEFFQERGQDLRIYVRPDNKSDELKGMLTSQIGNWIREIIGSH